MTIINPTIPVFIASPNDVGAERKLVESAIHSLAPRFAPELISQSGTTPKATPGDPSRQGTLNRTGGSGTDSLFKNAPRRWRFSQFSTTS
jgi:hypothetical protein